MLTQPQINTYGREASEIGSDLELDYDIILKSNLWAEVAALYDEIDQFLEDAEVRREVIAAQEARWTPKVKLSESVEGVPF